MNKKSNWLDRATALLEVIEKGRANTFERFDAVAKSGLLDIPFERYCESIEWYCGSDADRKQAKEDGVCGPLLFDDEFQEDLLFLLNTPLMELCFEEDPRLRNLPGAGMGLIQTIYFGVCSIAKNTTNVKEAKKCEFFKELFDQFGYETGAWFQTHGASGDLVRMIRRKAEECMASVGGLVLPLTDGSNRPVPVCVVEVDKSAGKSLRAALQDPGGRPPKTHGGAKVMTQAEMAAAFGEPCNEQMVANWEARAAGKKRGANPPDAIYKDEKIIYTSELRLNPTPDNKNRLSALIVEFQSRHRLKDDVGRKALHMKSPETLARSSGRIDAAVREQSRLKNES